MEVQAWLFLGITKLAVKFHRKMSDAMIFMRRRMPKQNNKNLLEDFMSPDNTFTEIHYCTGCPKNVNKNEKE